MAVMSCVTDWAEPHKSYTEYSFHGETKVRPGGEVNDPADLDIAYEAAKKKADTEAASRPDLTIGEAIGEATYEVFVRVVRTHRRVAKSQVSA